MQAGYAQNVRELSLFDAIEAAEKINPAFEAAQEREAQSKQSVRIARSLYFPTINFGAIDSYGFPGSSGGALQLQGVMSSPFRSGQAAGFFSQITLFDLAREYGLTASRYQMLSSKERTRIARINLDKEVLSLFLDASLSRSQLEIWRQMDVKTKEVAKIVKKLARNGQYSLVSLMLVEDQNTISKIGQVTYEERYQAALQRLALLTQIDSNTISCPALRNVDEKNIVGGGFSGESSPLVEGARTQAQAAHAKAAAAFSENLPRILAVASVGGMDNARLVARNDYSGGFGIVLPIFSGDRISAEVRKAQEAAQEKDREVQSAELDLADADVRYDEIIRVSRAKLILLTEEDKAAIESLRAATARYLSFIGTLVDVREAIRNIARVETDANAAKAEMLMALGSKTLINGGHLVAGQGH
ncbi:MAG: TolC family protein [Elusimicrobiota bacterium]